MNPSTPVVAWYGAIVSTLGFCLALYVALRDRPRLKIAVQANMTPYGDTSYDADKTYLLVNVANLGRRTVTIDAVWFSQKSRGSKDLLLEDALSGGPKEIPEGKSVHYVVEQEHFPGANLHRVFVRDLAGRVWKSRVPRSLRKAFSTADIEPRGVE